MGDVDEGDAGAPLQAAQFGAHVLAQLEIERRQRLVEQQHLRLDRQRAGDGHPLALTARQFARRPVAIALQRHQREQLVGLRPAGLAVHPARLKAEGDVVAHAHQRKQRQRLEDHRRGALVRPQPRHVAPADLDTALGRFKKPRDHAQDGGLAAARGAEDREELAVRHSEADAAHRARGAKGHADIYQRDGSRHGDFFHRRGARRPCSRRAPGVFGDRPAGSGGEEAVLILVAPGDEPVVLNRPPPQQVERVTGIGGGEERL